MHIVCNRSYECSRFFRTKSVLKCSATKKLIMKTPYHHSACDVCIFFSPESLQINLFVTISNGELYCSALRSMDLLLGGQKTFSRVLKTFESWKSYPESKFLILSMKKFNSLHFVRLDGMHRPPSQSLPSKNWSQIDNIACRVHFDRWYSYVWNSRYSILKLRQDRFEFWKIRKEVQNRFGLVGVLQMCGFRQNEKSKRSQMFSIILSNKINIKYGQLSFVSVRCSSIV